MLLTNFVSESGGYAKITTTNESGMNEKEKGVPVRFLNFNDDLSL